MKAPLPRTRGPSRRFIRVLLAAAILTVPLASCGMLSTGMFPADIAQMTRRIDLSNKIPAGHAASFNLSVLKLGTTEYVILFSTDGYDPTLTHLFVLSPTLEILKEYPLDFLNNTVLPSGSPFKGNAAVAHVWDGTVVIGNLVTIPVANVLTPSGKLATPTQLAGDTVVGPGPGYQVWTNFATDSSGNLFYEGYDPLWGTKTVQGHPVGKPYRFAGAFSKDPEDTANNTAMLVFEDDSNTQYFIRVPMDPDLAGGWPAPALLDNPDYHLFTMNNLDTRTLQVTKTGIVAYDYSSRAWVRFLPPVPGSPPAPPQVSQMDVGRRNGDQGSAFSFSGGFYCVFDPDTRELTRYEDWW